MYHLHLLLRNRVLIRNHYWEKSIQSRADSTVRVCDLEYFAKCWKQLFDDICELQKTNLCTLLPHDPNITVVPYYKYYNFALVTTYMHSL